MRANEFIIEYKSENAINAIIRTYGQKITDKLASDLQNPSDLVVDCGTDKTIELTESVWDDILFPVLSLQVGGTAPTLSTFQGNIKQYTFAINDICYGCVEIPHTYKEGTNLDAHVHIVTNGAESGVEARYELEYWFVDMGEASTTTTVITSADYTLTNADGQHEYIDLGDITGTNFKIGALLAFQLKRVALVDGSNPSSDPFVLSVGFHHQLDTMGSRQETAK